MEISNDVLEVELPVVAVCTPAVDTHVDDTACIEVGITRKEFSIVGDSIYIGNRVDDAPQWLIDYIDTLNKLLLNDKITEINGLSASLEDLIDAMNVAKNAYTSAIITYEDLEQMVNAKIETLNSSLSGVDSTIVNLLTTKVTAAEAQTIATGVISASVSGGAIGALVGNVQTALANEISARATDVNLVRAALDDVDTGLSGTAEAVQSLYGYVGFEDSGSPTGAGLLQDVQILQKQNDGIIETTTGTYDVMIGVEDPNNNTGNDELDVAKEPYASWKAADVLSGDIAKRSAHVGDVYIKYSSVATGYKTYERAYKFIKTVVDTTSPYSTDTDGFTWALITDTDAQNAYVMALNAYDLADDKRRMFMGSIRATVPYDVGDIWVVEAGNPIIAVSTFKAGDILRCIEAKSSTATYEQNDWVLASSYKDAIDVEAAALATWKTSVYASFVTAITAQVDKKAETFYQATIPTGRTTVSNSPVNTTLDKYVGDLWKNTYVGTVGGFLGNNTEYVYAKTANGANWDYGWAAMEVPDIVFDTIDTKKSIYTGNSVPNPILPDVVEENDMWITGIAPTAGYDAGSVYIYQGTGWIKPLKYTNDSRVILLETGLTNGTVAIDLSAATIDGTTALDVFIANQVDDQVVVFSGIAHATQTGMKKDDIYIEKTTATGTSGKVVDVVNTYKYNGTSWIAIGNNSNLTALADLADGKRTIFAGTTVPVGAVERDMWIPEANVTGGYIKGEVYIHKGTSWVAATKYTEDLGAFASTINTTLTSLQTQLDGKIEYWYQSTDPKTAWTTTVERNKHKGDVWHHTTTKISYYYDSSTHAWIAITNQDALNAIADAATAQATADGKINTYYGTRAGTVAEAVGDLLVASDEDNKMYRWNGTSWVNMQDKAIVANAGAITTLSTNLQSGIGTWANADSSLQNTLNTKIANDTAAVESKFAYNSNLVIGGVSYQSGFGLATSLTSGSGLTGSNSEFWVKADKFKLMSASGTKKSSYSPFAVDATSGEITFNGKVSFNSVTGVNLNNTNLLYNSAPLLNNATKGWELGGQNHGLSSTLGEGGDPWRPTGGASVYVVVPGSPTIGSVFDVKQINKVPVVAGKRYEASAYISAHRCTSYATIAWYDANNTYINEIGGSGVATSGGGALVNWGRSVLFVTAPANAAYAYFYVRSVIAGTDPYCFVSMAFMAECSSGQTVPSAWSEGVTASTNPGEIVSAINSGLTTTIDGGRITTGSITANQIAASTITTDKLYATSLSAISANLGTINAGVMYNSGANWSNYTMKIDLNAGEIHIR